MTKRLGQALDLFVLVTVPALLAWGIAETVRGHTGLGVFLISVACAVLWGVGGSVLQSWTGYEPGRHYLLGAVFVSGVMGGLSLENAIRADGSIHAAVSALGAAILLAFALVALYGWIKGPPSGQSGRDS